MSVMAIFRLTSARVFFDRRRPGYFSVDVGQVFFGQDQPMMFFWLTSTDHVFCRHCPGLFLADIGQDIFWSMLASDAFWLTSTKTIFQVTLIRAIFFRCRLGSLAPTKNSLDQSQPKKSQSMSAKKIVMADVGQKTSSLDVGQKDPCWHRLKQSRSKNKPQSMSAKKQFRLTSIAKNPS